MCPQGTPRTSSPTARAPSARVHSCRTADSPRRTCRLSLSSVAPILLVSWTRYLLTRGHSPGPEALGVAGALRLQRCALLAAGGHVEKRPDNERREDCDYGDAGDEPPIHFSSTSKVSANSHSETAQRTVVPSSSSSWTDGSFR